jgi:hypothetical protein
MDLLAPLSTPMGLRFHPCHSSPEWDLDKTESMV